jgi:hypothetical protein
MQAASPQQEYAIFSKQYVPAPYKPEWFDGALARIFGYNRLGQPKMIVEWGCNARTFRNGNPHAVKYPNPAKPSVGIDRWILAEWQPPEFFGTPEKWEEVRYYFDDQNRKIDLMGEYPSRGMYTMVMPICTKEGDYMPLSVHVTSWCESVLKDMHQTTWNEHTALTRLRQQEERIAREMKTDEEAIDHQVDELTDHFNTHGSRIEVVGTREYSKNLLATPENIQRVQKQLRGH